MYKRRILEIEDQVRLQTLAQTRHGSLQRRQKEKERKNQSLQKVTE